MIRLFVGVIAFCAVGFGLFVLAVEHPATKGPTRCWIQETFYEQEWAGPPAGTPIVDASAATEPVRDMCDAADDPAIVALDNGFYVLGTNKQDSINVYDSAGALVSRAEGLGAPNNVDVRRWKGRWLAFASEKDEGQILGFVLDVQNRTLKALPGFPFAAEAEAEVYGFCLYDAGDDLFAFTTDKSGMIVQYRLAIGSDGANTSFVRKLRVPTQPEGCVVDDAEGALYVGEEDVGIWRFDAKPDASSTGDLIAKTGAESELTADVEGLAIYSDEDESGYLIASSQGDNTYAVFDRIAPHAFRGRFQVRSEGAIVGDTDGLEVSSAVLGDRYPRGVLVVQDGMIRDAQGERRNQRFAIVSWKTVEDALGLSAE